MAPGSEYSSVPTASADNTSSSGGGCSGKCWKQTKHILLALMSVLLYLGDVATNLWFAAILIKYSGEDRLDVNQGYNFRYWAGYIIGLHILSGIFINFVATFDR